MAEKALAADPIQSSTKEQSERRSLDGNSAECSTIPETIQRVLSRFEVSDYGIAQVCLLPSLQLQDSILYLGYNDFRLPAYCNSPSFTVQTFAFPCRFWWYVSWLVNQIETKKVKLHLQSLGSDIWPALSLETYDCIPIIFSFIYIDSNHHHNITSFKCHIQDTLQPWMGTECLRTPMGLPWYVGQFLILNILKTRELRRYRHAILYTWNNVDGTRHHNHI